MKKELDKERRERVASEFAADALRSELNSAATVVVELRTELTKLRRIKSKTHDTPYSLLFTPETTPTTQCINEQMPVVLLDEVIELRKELDKTVSQLKLAEATAKFWSGGRKLPI